MNDSLVKKNSLKTTLAAKRFRFLDKLYDITKQTMVLATILSVAGPAANAQTTPARTPRTQRDATTRFTTTARQGATTDLINLMNRWFNEVLCEQYRVSEQGSSSCPTSLSQRAHELVRLTFQNSNILRANFHSVESITRYTEYMSMAALRSSINTPITAANFQEIFRRTGLPATLNETRTSAARQNAANMEAQRRQRMERLIAMGRRAEQNVLRARARLNADHLRELQLLIADYNGSARDWLEVGGLPAAQEVGRQTAYDEANRPLEAEQRRQLDETFDTATQGSQEGDSQPAPATQTHELRQ